MNGRASRIRARAYEERVQPLARGREDPRTTAAGPDAASGGAGTQGAFKARTVHRTSSKELVKVLGHRRPERLRRR
ncbi:hypothetical protein GCM10010255_27570 [Streptomyces coeruleofuscus]|uniref:Uncharacterized protein n=1 Tax=Streptomyces coeruleofuscus TaxID=66879 RepID=A0ABP5V8R2_9ACTN